MLRSIVASAVVVSIFAVGCAKPEFLAADRAIPVNVTIRCEGDSVVARIKPYSVRLANTDDDNEIAEWVLTDESNASEIEMTKKGSEDWPFDGPYPVKAKKNQPGKGTGVKKHKKGQHSYEYAISALCVLNGQAKKVVIDHDMIIIWN